MSVSTTYSGLNLNQYGVASPCPDLNLIHYNLSKGRLKSVFRRPLVLLGVNGSVGFAHENGK